MKSVYTPTVVHQMMFDDDQEYGDKYWGTATLISITPKVVLACGQLHRRRATSKEYKQTFQEWNEMGYSDLMYHSPKGRKDLAGDKVYVERKGKYERVRGLYLKSLGGSCNGGVKTAVDQSFQD